MLADFTTDPRSTVGSVIAFHTPGKILNTQQDPGTSPTLRLHEVFDSSLATELAAARIPEAAVHILAIAPIAHVAWFNETLTQQKRDLALKAAHLKGISRGTQCYNLLEEWLTRRPDVSMFSVWHDYIGALKWLLPKHDYQQLKTTTLERCRATMRATSGCFGLTVTNSVKTDELLLKSIQTAFE